MLLVLKFQILSHLYFSSFPLCLKTRAWGPFLESPGNFSGLSRNRPLSSVSPRSRNVFATGEPEQNLEAKDYRAVLFTHL